MRYRGQRWNNILILAIIAFIVILNLPTIVKTYLLDDEPAASVQKSPSPMLLNPDHQLVTLNSQTWSLTRKNDQWQTSIPLTVPADELVSRWKSIQGTVISTDDFQKLHQKLSLPQTIEVWYQEQEEPQRITYYQLPTFWLFKNWQEHWIAVSVDKSYLFPETKPQTK